MKFSSTKRVPSKLPDSPDVVFVLRKMNVFRRDQLDEIQRPYQKELLDLRDKLAALEPQLEPIRQELNPLTEEYREARKQALAEVQPERDRLIAGGMSEKEAGLKVPSGKVDFPDEKFQRWLKLNGEYAAIKGDIETEMKRVDKFKLTPTAVKHVLVRIEGLEIDDKEATFQDLLENGTDKLYDELAKEVARELGMLPEEKENLPLRSTSPAVENGAKTTGTADPAEMPVTTIHEAAENTTVQVNAIAPIIGSQQSRKVPIQYGGRNTQPRTES